MCVYILNNMEICSCIYLIQSRYYHSRENYFGLVIPKGFCYTLFTKFTTILHIV